MTTSYDDLNTLTDTFFIAGTDKVFTFSAYASDGVTPLNITSATIEWTLCRFGEFNQPIITKEGVIIDAYHFTVTLDANDTFTLSGKFIQQPIITDFSGNTFRPGQGTIIILPAIGATTTNFFPVSNGIFFQSNVGVGTVSPVYPLDIVGAVNSTV
jgi:hypothetical protein